MTEDLFRALIQGSGREGGGERGAGDALAGLLQGFLGGGSQQGGGETGAASGLGGMPDLGGLLQSVLGGGLGGGGGEQQAGGLGGGLSGILGAIMGGGGAGISADSFLAPIISGLVRKLGLPAETAEKIVAFITQKLLHGQVQSAAAKPQAGQQPAAAPTGSLNLDALLGKVSSGRRVAKADVRATGLARELQQQFGLDRKTAVSTVQEVFNALGGQLGSRR